MTTSTTTTQGTTTPTNEKKVRKQRSDKGVKRGPRKTPET